jgi:HSP20 family molecular chaperone IbpA
MKSEFEKNMLIASELLSYCHLMGADEFHLDVKITGGSTTFTIKASPSDISEEEMAHMLKRLNAPRQREIEQDYWHLSGDSESKSELMLLGMMSDEVKVEYEGELLTITIFRTM